MEKLDEIKNKFLKNWKNIVIAILAILLLGSIFSTDDTNLTKINELETQIQENKNEITTLQTEKTKLNNEIRTLEEENKTSKEQIKTLEEQIKEKEAETTTSNAVTKTETTQTTQSANQTNTVEPDTNSSTSSISEKNDEEEMVWVGETGTKYHYQSCRTLKGNGHQITMKQALAEGREACKVCH